ncbi:hypothetical protein AM571_CH04077 [Rhizobium etli 8C-3]|uniref:Uncharacterized protein n=1 Tax=Rhizobium etli 8C-3 TaxID=538025 RepID=A0A1L5P9V4_RHIET|nr:hypothetical protein AM571_CH04077 [Rhizobium etli 8C-3]
MNPTRRYQRIDRRREVSSASVRARKIIRFGGRGRRDGKSTVPANLEKTWIEDPDLRSNIIERHRHPQWK